MISLSFLLTAVALVLSVGIYELLQGNIFIGTFDIVAAVVAVIVPAATIKVVREIDRRRE